MACYGVYGSHVIIDCRGCEGLGYHTVLRGYSPPAREDCEVCGGKGIVRVPIDEIKILGSEE
jgi:hypothetical protein